MALMPGFDTRSAAQVAGQVAQENLQARAQDIGQEQFQAGLAQRDRELALQAFQANQRAQIARMEQTRLAEQSARNAALRHTKLAVETGIKFDPASRQYRPLTEDDTEFNSWKERQAERKAKLPLSPDAKIQLARETTAAVEGAREPFRMRQEQRTEAARGRQFREETLRREQEGRANARRAASLFKQKIIAKDLEDTRRAEEQVELVKARKWATEEAIRLRHRLSKPERDLKALSAKQKEEEKGRERKYFRAQAAYERASNALLQAVKFREAEDKKLWDPFVKRFSTAPWFDFNFTPGRKDIEPGGQLEQEWNKVMFASNQAVERARKKLRDARKIADAARDEYIGLPQQARTQLPAAPPQEEMDALIKKHGGDWKAAQAEWEQMRKAE